MGIFGNLVYHLFDSKLSFNLRELKFRIRKPKWRNLDRYCIRDDGGVVVFEVVGTEISAEGETGSIANSLLIGVTNLVHIFLDLNRLYKVPL